MSNESESDKSDKKDFFDRIIHLDQKTATKYIIKGFIFVIIFGSIVYTSSMVYSYAGTYYNLENQRLKNAFYDGEIGDREYREQINDLQETQYLMQYQYVIIASIARFAACIAMIFIVLGFIGYANNTSMDDKTRIASLIMAIIFLFMAVSAVFGGFKITIGT